MPRWPKRGHPSRPSCQGRVDELGSVDVGIPHGSPSVIQAPLWRRTARAGSDSVRGGRHGLGEGGAAAAGQADRPRCHGEGQPAVSRGGAVAGADRRALARPAGRLRQVEQRLPALPPLGEGRRVRARLRLPVRRAGLRVCPGRRHHRHRPPEGEWRKGGTQTQAIGRSRGGLTTKIVALADALGNLVRFVLLPGQRHDTVGVRPLIEGVAFNALLGDKAFDVDWIRADLDARGAAAVIPPKASRKGRFDLDRDMYGWRHLIENTFAKLKEFRAVATRYDKTDTSYAATIHLAAAVIASR